jgi:opacity protein-like surface antigen
VLRYPLGQGPSAVVVGGSLTYGKQKFEVFQSLPNGEKTDIPNVNYTMISPAVFIQAPVAPKITLLADAAFHAITNTGDIQTPAQYGASTVTGFEVNAGVDYALSPSLFVRVSGRYETISFKFKGDPMSMTHTRDTDPDQDVTGAKDSYLGGTATIGYLY